MKTLVRKIIDYISYQFISLSTHLDSMHVLMLSALSFTSLKYVFYIVI